MKSEDNLQSKKLIDLHDEIPKKLCKKKSNDGSESTYSSSLTLPRMPTVYKGETVWRINSFSKKLKKISAGTYEEPSRSEPFSTGAHGYRLAIWAYLNGRGKCSGKYLSLFIRVLASEVDAILPWPVKPCYSFCLLSQDPDPSKRLDFIRIRDLTVKHVGISRPQKDDKSFIVGFDDFIHHDELVEKNFLADDTLFIKCNVEIYNA
ncbi:TNF receptor-associated factor 4 isoform X1 [Hydra vulgaris]|uniref:TNF receptor-associated factor 4 isoform X1 n=1 Tax=Hydra vulgaris TaxID=6087 RepID=UPI0002B4A5A8|nr:TNF receptor-associated factor 4 [Hydra vulgaris]XP_047128310.1 TNF receptor-associated factor 4 [Hydra vulgaris]